MVKKNFLKSSLIIALAVITALTVAAMLPNKVSAASNDSETVSLTYSAHMQTYGDGSIVEAGNEENETPTSFAGVIGESKRMESLAISFEGPEGVSLKYQAHVQGIGWQDAVTATKDNTTFIGTKGQSKRVEAIKLTVVGLDKLTAAGHSIKYRAHVQGEGWQDWVTADDKAYNAEGAKFAGTTNQSKRIEAIEIVVVHEHQYTYSPVQNLTNDARHVKLCAACGSKVEEQCTFGEWLPTPNNNSTVTRTCVCGNKQTKALSEVIKDDSVKTIEVNSVKEDIEIPEGKTLIVDNAIDAGKNVKVYGTLTLKKAQNNLKLSGSGKVVWAPEVEGETEAAKVANFKTTFANTDFLKLSSRKLEDAGTNHADASRLSYEILVPEMAEPQVITDVDTDALTLGTDWNVTIDLGKNILQSYNRSGATDILENKGNMTIKNGILEDKKNENDTSATNNYVIKNTGTLTLENVTVKAANRKGIVSDGNLTMTNCEVIGTENSDRAIQIGSADGTDLANKTIKLENVKVDSVGKGIYASGKNTVVNLKDCDVKASTLGIAAPSTDDGSKRTFKVTGGKITVTADNGTLGALLTAGETEITGCTLSGAHGIELAGPRLTVKDSSINITGDFTNYTNVTCTKDITNNNGCAISLHVMDGYKVPDTKYDILVSNTTITTKNGYAVRVAGNENNSQSGWNLPETLPDINVSFENVSYTSGAGNNAYVLVAPKLQSKVTTMYK